MATKMKITDLKKVLKNADKDELEMLICELYKQDDEKMYLLFKDRLARLSNDVGSIGWGYCDYMQEEILNLECFFMEEEDND